MRRASIALLSLASLATFAVLAACSSKASLVGQGGQCEVVADCQEGLACVPGKDGNRTCTNDLSGVQKTPDMPAMDSGAAQGDDGSADAPSSQDDAPSTQDSSQPDTSAPADSAAD